jgi:hypothetical protein
MASTPQAAVAAYFDALNRSDPVDLNNSAAAVQS